MTRVLVNSQPRDPEPGLKTLGDLLAWADRTSASDGAVVTAVRLDGVEEPSFRDDAFAARPLDGIAVVEMEVATPASLVAASLDEAIRGLTGLRRHTVEIAQRFRRADAVHANEGLAELTAGLRTLVSLLDALGTAMGVPLERTACNGQTAGEVLEGLGGPLAALAEAQAQQDWVTVADILEFDLEPALGRCEPFFAGLSALAHRALSAH